MADVRPLGAGLADPRAVDLAALLASPRNRLLLIAAGVVAAGIGGGLAVRGPAAPQAASIPAVAAPGRATTLLVFVSGAVAHPGLYELASGARIADAIAAAGGMLPSADPGRLPDLAGLVHDGHQVNVPFRKGSSSAVAARVDVNTATLEELEGIPGMTADLARAIVDARTQWGPFASLADLRTTLGLDSASAALIGRHLTFASASP
ncbi:MAG: ComEA family DNA-binding protein [Candidatus Dormibacteria bacterium]